MPRKLPLFFVALFVAGPALGENRPEATDTPSATQLLQFLGDFRQPEFLPVDDAFQLQLTAAAGDRLRADFRIADGYYLYRKSIAFSATDGAPLAGDLPPGVLKTDEYFGTSQVFKRDFTAPIALQTAADKITVNAKYQGCAEDGICYPPVQKQFTLQLPAFIAEAAADATPAASPADVSANAGADPRAQNPPPSPNLIAVLAGAFLAGLLLTFTPCVLPMLPIVSAIIAGQGNTVTVRRGALLAAVYILGTAVTYAGMGALAGAAGAQLQAYFQNLWAIGALALLLLAMAASMFGFFTLQMPSFLQAKLQGESGGKTGGTLSAVFVLGAFSAAVVGACVSPILITFLGLAISAGDAGLGAMMMTAMALGMGVPLLLLGAGFGHYLPKAGAWMQRINHLFGVLLIAVAIYLLGNLPQVPVLLLWGAFFIIIATFLRAPPAFTDAAGGWHFFRRGVGTILLVWGIVALLGGFFGERDVLRPLPSFSAAGVGKIPAGESSEIEFTSVADVAELDAQFAAAAAADKLVLLDYYADWCIDCQRMKKTTFVDPQVRAALTENFVALQVDLTDPRDAGARALKEKYGVFGPPAVLFFGRDGAPIADKNFYGYLDADSFLTLLREAVL